MSNISYDSEDAARVAELLLAAGRAAEIPRYPRRGARPEMVERELEGIAHVVADHGGRAAEGRDKADLDSVACESGA